MGKGFDPSKDTTVTITDQHVALLKRLNVGWDDSCYDGAPAVGIKRPYGNSDVIGDVFEIVGWEHDEDEDYTDEEVERALALHRETQYALQVLVQHPGEDIRGTWTDNWPFNEWSRV